MLFIKGFNSTLPAFLKLFLKKKSQRADTPTKECATRLGTENGSVDSCRRSKVKNRNSDRIKDIYITHKDISSLPRWSRVSTPVMPTTSPLMSIKEGSGKQWNLCRRKRNKTNAAATTSSQFSNNTLCHCCNSQGTPLRLYTSRRRGFFSLALQWNLVIPNKIARSSKKHLIPIKVCMNIEGRNIIKLFQYSTENAHLYPCSALSCAGSQDCAF